MRILLNILFLFVTPLIWSQEIDPDYKQMIERKYDFPTISPDSLQTKLGSEHYIILDTREHEEYDVSHIPGALEFGYDNPKYNLVSNIDTETTIVVYCSIGVRSEKIGENLKDKGFTKVFNLYGGIFLWADQFRPLDDNEGSDTDKVHGYNKYWGRWVKKAPVVYE